VNSGINFWEDSGYSVPESSLAPIVNGKMMGSMREELSYFVDSLLRGEAPTVASMEDGLHGHRVVDAIIESATIGQDVEIQ
jgi:predicted dehydrogenase